MLVQAQNLTTKLTRRDHYHSLRQRVPQEVLQQPIITRCGLQYKNNSIKSKIYKDDWKTVHFKLIDATFFVYVHIFPLKRTILINNKYFN